MVIDIQIDCKKFVKNRLLKLLWFAKTEEVTGASNLNYVLLQHFQCRHSYQLIFYWIAICFKNSFSFSFLIMEEHKERQNQKQQHQVVFGEAIVESIKSISVQRTDSLSKHVLRNIITG